MATDMTKDVFADQSFGKAALKAFGQVANNFRLYEAGWIENTPPFNIMKVSGASFRIAKTGPNKGKLSILVPGTKRSVHISRSDMAEFEKAKPRATKIRADLKTDHDMFAEFEDFVRKAGSALEPPCGMANCLKRDQFGYTDRYMRAAFKTFELMRKAGFAQVLPANFSDFKDFAVDKKYSSNGCVYPPLPTPDIVVNGVNYWDRATVIDYGVAVESSSEV